MTSESNWGDLDSRNETIAGPPQAPWLSPAPRSMRTTRIIVAGSAKRARRELRFALEAEGYRVSEARTADQLLQDAYSGRHHLIILVSGFECLEPDALCRWIRLKSDLGIIVLAATGARQVCIDTLNAGADYYLPLVFTLPELLARVRALLRRAKGPSRRIPLAAEEKK